MLSTPDTQKLAKLLGMLGSAHDGEVINAARKAQDLVSRHGVSWSDVVGARDTSKPIIPHHVLAVELLQADGLTLFERNFLKGIMAFQTLSSSQDKTLETIRAKVDIAKQG